jgi:hypothetical protein
MQKAATQNAAAFIFELDPAYAGMICLTAD